MVTSAEAVTGQQDRTPAEVPARHRTPAPGRVGAPRSWWPRTLSGRMTLVACVAVLVPLAATDAAVVAVAERGERSAVDRQLRANLDTLRPPADGVLSAAARPGPAGAAPPAADPPPPPAGALDLGPDNLARVVDAGGTVRRAEGRAGPAALPVVPADGNLRTVTVDGRPWRTGAVSLGGAGTLQVAVSLAPLEQRLRDLYTVAAGCLLIAFAGSVLLAWALGRLALAPLRRLGAAAVSVGRHPEANLRVPHPARPAETAALARELNTMLARLQQARAARDQALAGAQRFAADAGHELRTPLTSLAIGLRTLLHRDDPATRAAVYATAQQDVTRMSVLVDQLQDLARGEAPLSARPERVDVGEVVDAATDAFRARNPAVRVDVIAPPDGPMLTGDPAGVRSIVDNLLENVARHAGERAHASVFLTATPGRTVLVVDDDGPGVPAGERGRVLQRFARGSVVRAPGTGLGLAIVAAEVRRHGGAVDLQTSPAGGLRVHVVFTGAGDA